MENSHTAPEPNDLLSSLKELLRAFDPTRLSFLNAHGDWEYEPQSIRDRISNELLFTLWELRSEGDFDSKITELVHPFVKDTVSWNFARQIPSYIPGEEAVTSSPLLVVLKALCHLIEYDACERNADCFVPEWDSKGKAKREAHRRRTYELTKRLAETEDAGPSEDAFFNTLALLKTDESSVFARVAEIVSQEERFREEIQGALTDIKDPQKAQDAYDFIGELLTVRRGSSGSSKALLRPCMELLADREISISSGVQYRASALLGVLGDVRSTKLLLNSLHTCDRQHTHLRSNLVYALGNLRQNRALSKLIDVLKGPDSVSASASDGSSCYTEPLDSEKREAIWAIGKLGGGGAEGVPALLPFAGSADRETRAYLAWALGMIGSGQKEEYGGIDAGLLTALLTLLTSGDNVAFEEATFALKNLGLPDFLHTLYLHDFATIPILSLKPSSTGLYELSETIDHLASIKRPVVMAVTGDSGTGKTYFCETIAGGFSGIEAREILYLMRDTDANKVLDRILGLKWLKRYNEPVFYQDYPLSEDKDDPQKFFDDFIQKHSDKKLIILDGWRDKAYFHEVIARFYEKGYLDVLVKFQTTLSTRRINLEKREGTLERLKMHLPLVEDPVIEETPLYQEGAVLIYNLDNSIPSRLNREEILEVFQRRKVDTWADLIRIGEFTEHMKPFEIRSETLTRCSEEASFGTAEFPSHSSAVLNTSEASFSRKLNDNLRQSPNLLEIIDVPPIPVRKIAFYTQGQFACCGYDGSVGILTGFNDRVFHTKVHARQVVDLAVLNRDIYSIGDEGNVKVTSFHRNEKTEFAGFDSPAVVISAYRGRGIVTGHSDGTIRFWDLQTRKVTHARAHEGPVLSIAVGRSGLTYSGGSDGLLLVWDLERQNVTALTGHGAPISAIAPYPDGRIVTGTRALSGSETPDGASIASIRIIDFEEGDCAAFAPQKCAAIDSLSAYFDGRIIAATRTLPGEARQGSLIVADPRAGFCSYKSLEGHRLETRVCVTMGPKIVTCGSDSEDEHTLRTWGTTSYVESELRKLRLIPKSMHRPPYYRSLF